jgi:hypothetical protein
MCVREPHPSHFMGECDEVASNDWNRFFVGDACEAYVTPQGDGRIAYSVVRRNPDGSGASSHFFSEGDFGKYFIKGGEAEYQVYRKSRLKHDLGKVERTKGGHKLKAHELSYAVYPDGSWAGIIGDVWRANAYRTRRWYDDGTSYGSDAAFDLPFAPERQPAPAAEPADLERRESINWRPDQRLYSFGAAIEALKRGKRIARLHWDGYWLLTDSAVFVPTVSEVLAVDNLPVSGIAMGVNFVVAVLKNGTMEAAQPYQADWLATDWLILD